MGDVMTMSKDEFKALKKKLIEQMLRDMPEDLKKAGVTQDPALIEKALDVAGHAAASLFQQLFTLLIAKPRHQHTCTLTFPPLQPEADEPAADYAAPANSFPQGGAKA